MISIDQVRSETPGCTTKAHFNNAGSSLPPHAVIEAQRAYLEAESVTGGYETADLQSAEIDRFYSVMGQLLGCLPENVAFTSSATSSFDKALSCIPLEHGDKVLIAQEDYISNQLALLSLQKRVGIKLVRAESLAEGGVDPDSMRHLMDKHRPKLVSLTHVPTNSGLIQPVSDVGILCKERGIPYLVDGCQSTGQLPVNMQDIHCDFFCGTFRKFLRGPRGTGFLFVSNEVLKKDWWPLYVDMRGADWTDADAFKLRPDAKRFEEWELPYTLLAGCREAAAYALRIGLHNIAERNASLCSLLRDGLASLGLRLLDNGKSLSSIITVEIPGKNSSDVLTVLRRQGINTSISSRGAAVMDFDAKGVSWALRISPHYYNSEDEIKLLLKSLKEII